jgi:hypothetical protein
MTARPGSRSDPAGAWSLRRVDAPALAFYQRSGLRPFRRQVEVVNAGSTEQCRAMRQGMCR